MKKTGIICRLIALMLVLSFVVLPSQATEATDVTEVVYNVAKELIEESWDGQPLRLIGLSITDIDRDGFEQMSLIVDERKEKMKKLDAALDNIRGRFGDESVKRASTVDVGARINRKHKAEGKIFNDKI